MAFLRHILKSGVVLTHDHLEKRRVVFFNYLILFCIFSALAIVLITATFGFYTQSIVCAISMVLFSVPLVLNRYGHITFSKFLFLGLALALITVGTTINLNQGLMVQSENLLFAVMSITMFILDGKQKHIAYWVAFLVFLCLKIFSYSFLHEKYGFHFALMLINNGIVGIVIYAFLAAFRSILMRALDRNEQSERHLSSMIDNVPVFIAMVDTNGRFVQVNKSYANNFDYEKREILGKLREEVLPSALLKGQKEYFDRALKGESVPFLQETLMPNGEIISANGKYEPILNDAGEVELIAICVDDVTPLIKAQEAMRVANETKDKLFSIIAHDIKSPLNMFQTFLNLSEQTDMSAKDFFEYQQTLKQRLSALTETVDSLLEWSRMQLGGINAYPSIVNVNTVVNENIDLFDSLIQKKNIDFSVNASTETSAWIDENHFKVALRNLIHNAIKYTNGGGKVEVSADQNDNETIVRISDTGIGMNTETINSIINKEIQSSKAGTDKELGTGLGLSLSVGLLEKNNCEISVVSEPNKGTCFEIKIPRNQN
ncbi:MAG: hypothetical protein Tsb0034_23560 [Ekhidna sp.]